MTARKDLTGQKFGRLTVLGYDHTNSRGEAYWKCCCDCGNECVVRGQDLSQGKRKSCGCLKHRPSGARISIEGKKFGRLTVINHDHTDELGRIFWRCRCECGEERIVLGSDLRSGKSKSCGCLHKEKASLNNLKHGMSDSETFGVWANIKARCSNTNRPDYKDYGGRGITIFPAWVDNFSAFYDYVSKLEHFDEEGYTLDRIDNGGNYEPGNLRWATRSEQARNRRSNVFVEYNGEKLTLTEAAKRSGINYSTLRSRFKNGDRGERLFRPAEGR